MTPLEIILQEIPHATALRRIAERRAPAGDVEDVFQELLIDAIKHLRYQRRRSKRGLRQTSRFVLKNVKRRLIQRLHVEGGDCLAHRQSRHRVDPASLFAAYDEDGRNEMIEAFFFFNEGAEAPRNVHLLDLVEQLAARLTEFEIDVLLSLWGSTHSGRKATCKSGGERATADREPNALIVARELRVPEWKVRVAICNIREAAQKLGANSGSNSPS